MDDTAGLELQILMMVFLFSKAVANVFTKEDFPLPVSPIKMILMYGTLFVMSDIKLLKNFKYSATTYVI